MDAANTKYCLIGLKCGANRQDKFVKMFEFKYFNENHPMIYILVEPWVDKWFNVAIIIVENKNCKETVCVEILNQRIWIKLAT